MVRHHLGSEVTEHWQGGICTTGQHQHNWACTCTCHTCGLSRESGFQTVTRAAIEGSVLSQPANLVLPKPCVSNSCCS